MMVLDAPKTNMIIRDHPNTGSQAITLRSDASFEVKKTGFNMDKISKIDANKLDHFKVDFPSQHISVRFNYRPTEDASPKYNRAHTALTEGYNAGGINVVTTVQEQDKMPLHIRTV
jgi:hypothetical protein